MKSVNTQYEHQRSPVRRWRWIVPALLMLGWLVLGGVGGSFMGKLADVSENDRSTFLPTSAESTKVGELQQRFSGDDAVPAIVVAERSGGLTAADREFLGDAVGRLSSVEGVDRVSPPISSPDGDEAAQLVAAISGGADPGDVVPEMRQMLDRAPSGLTVLVTGPAGLSADLGEAFGGIDGLLLLVAGCVVALILILVYRSPILPLVVLLSSVFALGLASLVVYVLAANDLLMLNGQSQGILFILVFGAATDYALLLVSRFREELRDAADPYRAVRTAWRASIEPIAASAGTVILGVLCLLFSDLNSNKGLGPVAAIGIAASFLATVTFLPAALAVCGPTVFWPFRPTLGSQHPETSGLWRRVARRVGGAPRAVWIVTVALLIAGTAFVPQLKAGGTSQSDIFLVPVESVAGQRVLAAHFPGGAGAPTQIIADADRTAAVVDAAQVPGVTRVTPAGADDGAPTVVDGMVRIEAVLAAPASSEEAIDTVRRIRASVHAVPGADAKVGGPTAIQLDTRIASKHDRTVIMPLVLLVTFVVLAALMRALIAPLLLIATVVLSFAATTGVSALVFNHVFDFPGADPAVPLYGFVFLVALGIDYNIFLMTRVREEVVRSDHRTGILRGLASTGGVITSAGVVLAATFAALAVLPILFLAQLAFIVAFGVLLDTLVVRSLLVPALALDIGRVIWWPSKLASRESTPMS